MADLEARREQLVVALAAAATDYTRLAELSTDLASLEEQLAATEHRWLELSEELGASARRRHLQPAAAAPPPPVPPLP